MHGNMLFLLRTTLTIACLWLFLGASLWAQASSTETITVDCQRCAATGEVSVPCASCAEVGTFPCPICPQTRPKDVLGPPSEVTPEIWKKVTRMFHDHWDKKEQVTPTPGTVFCGWYCADGKLGNREECGLCKGAGSLSCPACPGEGSLPCWECKAKKSLPVSCPDCLGKRRFSVDEALAPDASASCPFCRDRVPPECTFCEGEGTRRAKCSLCRGQKKTPCLTCNAKGKLHCAKCWGSGLSIVVQAKEQDKCTDCRGKGHQKCPECKGRKKVACATCTGKGKVLVACETCGAQGKRICHGCADGSFSSWERVAVALGEAGQEALGLQFLEAAATRCTTVHHGRLLEIEERSEETDAARVQSEKKELESQYLLDQERLERLRAHLQELAQAAEESGS